MTWVWTVNRASSRPHDAVVVFTYPTVSASTDDVRNKNDDNNNCDNYHHHRHRQQHHRAGRSGSGVRRARIHLLIEGRAKEDDLRVLKVRACLPKTIAHLTCEFLHARLYISQFRQSVVSQAKDPNCISTLPNATRKLEFFWETIGYC